MTASSPPTVNFADWLNSAMSSRQMNQADLARELHVFDSVVSRWRHGSGVPRLAHIERLAVTFNVPRATLEQLAGIPANPLANGQTATAATDPALVALLEQEQAALHNEVQSVPADFWLTILEASRAARRMALETYQALRQTVAATAVSATPEGVLSASAQRTRGTRARPTNGRKGGITPEFSPIWVTWQHANA